MNKLKGEKINNYRRNDSQLLKWIEANTTTADGAFFTCTQRAEPPPQNQISRKTNLLLQSYEKRRYTNDTDSNFIPNIDHKRDRSIHLLKSRPQNIIVTETPQNNMDQS